MCATLILMSAVLFARLANAQLASSPWPMFHHDLEHSGLSTVDTSANNGSLKWQFSTGLRGTNSPAIGSDGTIYIGSAQHFYRPSSPTALKNGSSHLVLLRACPPRLQLDKTAPFTSVLEDDHLYAINPDGTEKWKFSTLFRSRPESLRARSSITN